MSSSLPAVLRRWFSQRHFFAGVAIPCFAVFILFIGGFKSIEILLHEARTTATVTEIQSNGRGRSSLYYRYEVGGHAYTGRGGPDHQPFTPPFSPGCTFEIRYSTLFPFFSLAQNPLTIFGQFAVGCLFLLWAAFNAIRYGKKRESNA